MPDFVPRGPIPLAEIQSCIVHLCENDDRGEPRGRINAVHFSTGINYDRPPVLELESRYLYIEGEEEDENPTCERVGRELHVAGEVFAIRDVRHHVGNIFWNGYLVSVADARKIAALLRDRFDWSIEAEETGQPFLRTPAARS